ncbi:MAG: cellulase family glycosylhydrolase, partial [Clostridia bacterium]|nr:cellulase family glycosylhydrolase [Clostridia bacterium]
MRIFTGFQHGVNLGGWLSQCDATTEAHFNTFITEADIRRIQDMGLDHVRLPVDYNWIEDEAGAPIEAGMKHIDDCVGWCEAAGLNLLLDLHKAFGYTFDPLEKDADREIFFHDAALQARFIALWQRLARRYGPRANVAFDLLNEVISPNVAEPWNDIVERTISAIREIAPDTWIVVGGVCYNNVRSVPLLAPPHDERVVYNFHCYEPMVFTHQKAYWVEGMPDDLDVAYPDALERYVALSKQLSF